MKNKAQLILASLLLSSAAMAQTTVKPMIMKTPNEYRIVSASGNGKWACGVYADYGDERYGFLWNLESGEIELLNPSNPSIAYSVSDDGLVVGQYTDNTYKKNGASVTLAGYWANHKWNRLEMPDVEVNYANAYAVSPDGHYVCGVVQNGNVYTGYVWKDGKIIRKLENHNDISMPYAVSPDGQLVAGWAQDENRSGCIWDADGKLTFLNPEYQSPWSSGRKFTHDGKKLLYFGGWEEDENGEYGANVIYDVATGERTKVYPAIGAANFDVLDLSDTGVLMCENNDRGLIIKDNVATYADDYLTSVGIDLAEEHVFKAPETDYFQVSRASTISADGNIMGFQYYNDDMDADGNYSVSMQSMIVKFNQPTTGLCPAGVKAEQLSGLASVLVAWKPNVAAEGITGYNVYRDGTKVNSSLLTGEEYVDNGVAYGNHKYAVTAVYSGAESAKSDEATVAVAEKKLSAPVGLFAQQHGYNSAYLEWNNPETNFGSITYFDGDNANIETFGMSFTGMSYETAIRYDATRLSAYKGQQITSVGFYPMSEQEGWKVNFYTHDAAGKLQTLYSQPVTQTLNYGVRNVVTLATPLDVPTTGDLLVAVEATVKTAEQAINALDYGKGIEGYTDLVRLTTEDDFYSFGALNQSLNYLYEAIWAIDATVAPNGSDLTKDDVKTYNVYADGSKVGTTDTPSYLFPSLADGTHTVGVSAVYANGTESDVNTTSITVSADESQLASVDNVIVNMAENSTTAVNATWTAPVASDKVNVQYCMGAASNHAVNAPESNNYCLMASAVYPSKTFRGRDGYIIKAARFYPLADAEFTVSLYKDGQLVDETPVNNYTLKCWNEVELENPVVVNSKSTYQLVVDCYDVTPNSAPLALDDNASVTGYSDLYSIDGESWNPLSSTAVFNNWMIGLRIEDPKAEAIPVAGYDVRIDGVKKNTEMLTSPTFTYDFGKADDVKHTINVDTYYTINPTSVKGGTMKFYISTTDIADNVIARIEVRQGNNELTVEGDGVSSVELVSAAGATVAKAGGNTVSLDGIAAGAYVVKAVVNGATVTRKIVIAK